MARCLYGSSQSIINNSSGSGSHSNSQNRNVANKFLVACVARPRLEVPPGPGNTECLKHIRSITDSQRTWCRVATRVRRSHAHAHAFFFLAASALSCRARGTAVSNSRHELVCAPQGESHSFSSSPEVLPGFLELSLKRLDLGLKGAAVGDQAIGPVAAQAVECVGSCRAG